MSREAIPDNREGSCIVPILLGSLSSLSLSTIFRLSAACGPSPASSSAKHFAYTQSEARLVYLPTAYAFVLPAGSCVSASTVPSSVEQTVFSCPESSLSNEAMPGSAVRSTWESKPTGRMWSVPDQHRILHLRSKPR